jgi:carbonic anhydrase
VRGYSESNGTTDGKFVEWLTITDQAKSVLSDVERIRNNSMVPDEKISYHGKSKLSKQKV